MRSKLAEDTEHVKWAAFVDEVLKLGFGEKWDVAPKLAEHTDQPDPQTVLQMVQPILVALLALTQLYYFAHWTAKGQNSYGDHQLYERLYKSTQEEYDKVAERLVGLCGQEALDGVFTLAAAKNEFWVKECGKGDTLCAAQNGEAETQSTLAQAYRALDENMALTLGLDEVIMNLASQHETNSYLLKQRADASKEAGLPEVMKLGFGEKWDVAGMVIRGTANKVGLLKQLTPEAGEIGRKGLQNQLSRVHGLGAAASKAQHGVAKVQAAGGGNLALRRGVQATNRAVPYEAARSAAHNELGGINRRTEWSHGVGHVPDPLGQGAERIGRH